jgi:hypothetical protein
VKDILIVWLKTSREKAMKWSYGLTSCDERHGSVSYRKTLESLNRAGFATRGMGIFIDGEKDKESYGIVGNWILSAWELFLRNPKSDMYAIFQDDIICCRDIKPYLQKTVSIHADKYYNLYTGASNYSHIGNSYGWNSSNQLGRGALALVFPRPVFMKLLSSQELVSKPQQVKGTISIDGTISTALKQEGVEEMVHYPSLVQHRDEDEVPSTKGGLKGRVSPCFPGEDWYATEALTCV